MSVYDLAGVAWDAVVDDSGEPCQRCGHDLGLHALGTGCDECSCVYGLDGWALDDETDGGAW
jgi:hypothetical protein